MVRNDLRLTGFLWVSKPSGMGGTVNGMTTTSPEGASTTTPEWKRLERLAEARSGFDLRAAFRADPGRAERFTFEAGDLVVDLSKHLIDAEVIEALVSLAGSVGLSERIGAMFVGDHINTTEDRPVLHTALRAGAGTTLEVDGTDVVADVHGVLEQMSEFSNRVRSGSWLGHTGERIRSIIKHRHRRVRPGSGNGLPGATSLSRDRPESPLRL